MDSKPKPVNGAIYKRANDFLTTKHAEEIKKSKGRVTKKYYSMALVYERIITLLDLEAKVKASGMADTESASLNLAHLLYLDSNGGLNRATISTISTWIKLLREDGLLSFGMRREIVVNKIPGPAPVATKPKANLEYKLIPGTLIAFAQDDELPDRKRKAKRKGASNGQ